MSAFDDQMCTEMNKVPQDCLDRSYWRRKLPPAFRFFLEVLSRELLLSSPSNTFAHSAGFFEELLIQRDMELSLLPYEPYLGKLLKQKGLEQQHKLSPRAEGAGASRPPGSSPCMRCAKCGGIVCEQLESPSPVPDSHLSTMDNAGERGPDFAIFGDNQGQVGGAGPSAVQPPCKRCCHCHGELTSEPQVAQAESSSPEFTKGPDFAIFGSDYTEKTPQGQAACPQCGCQLGQLGLGDMGRVSPTGAKVEEEFPKYEIIPFAYETEPWGRLGNFHGRKKDDPEGELINARSLSFLMDY